MPNIIFRGVSLATALPNVIIEQLPDWKKAKRRYSSETPSGYDGRVYGADAPFDVYQATARVTCSVSDRDAVTAFFDGEGWVSASNMPNREVYARVFAEEQPRHYPAGDISVMVTFECMPYKYITPAASNIVKTTSGTTITNPGTAASAPKIAINGSGTFSVTISNGTVSKTLFFENVPSGGIVYDSELKDALSPDGTVLMTQYMQFISDFDFVIPSGNSVLSWNEAAADAEEGITAGHVTSVTITPRWRCL